MDSNNSIRTNRRTYGFPCWDEPEYKSIFSISLTSDENLVRVSNEKLAEETTNNGRTTSKFVDSMRMSTYLVAFVVGGLEITNTIQNY